MILSIVVPVYNEEKHLAAVIKRLMESACPIEREWIFVEDCSSDQSLAILKALAPTYGFRVIAQSPNQGKGSAVRRGIAEAKGNFILIQDADFEYDPADIAKLVAPLAEGRADVVYGSRFLKTGVNQVHRTYHYFVNRILTVLSNLFSGLYLTDMETCSKIFRADMMKAMNLTSARFGIEIELTAYVAKIRARVYELPVSYFPRQKLQGKKINWKDGVAALYHIVRFNWFVSAEKAFKFIDPSWNTYSSHDPEAFAPKEVKKPQ